MRLENNPLFRRASIPWYDGNTACWMVLMGMLCLSLFSWAGIYVARTHPFYDGYLWVPITLLILSLLVALSLALRLFHRYYERYMQNKDL